MYMKAEQSGITLESSTFSEESGEYTATYDQHVVSPSMALIGAVSDAKDTDPLELNPLFETVDSDMLDGLLRSAGNDPVQVTFTFAGCEVTMTGDSRIRLVVPEE